MVFIKDINYRSSFKNVLWQGEEGGKGSKGGGGEGQEEQGKEEEGEASLVDSTKHLKKKWY